MGLIAQAKKDIERILSDTDGFAVTIDFEGPKGDTASITGTHKKHHLGINPETGEAVNTKTASVSVSEKFLTDLNYPVRNSKGEVFLKKHLVSVKDSTGALGNYIVTENFPDETIGLIVCILGSYEQD